MEAKECLKTRRSVRRFTAQPVTAETLTALVEIASYAPSWKNTQTARYTAVLDADQKTALAENCMMDFAYNTKTVNGAPALIVVSSVNARAGFERDGSFSTALGTHWQSFDAGIAAQTFCLAAHEAGLGTVILGIFDAEKVAQAIELPEGESVSCLIALGYPDEQPVTPKRRSVEELLRIK